MRIAVTRRADISCIDGVNRFIYVLAEGLENLGHKVFLIGHTARYQKKAIEIFGPKVKEAYKLSSKESNYAKIAIDWLFKGSLLIKRLKIDAILMNGIVPILSSKLKVAICHGVFESKYTRIGSLLYNTCDIVVCVSSKLRNELRMRGIIIPIPIKISLYKARPLEEREPLILHVGTRPVKNPEISIKAVKILREKGYNLRLLIAGPLRSDLPKYDFVNYTYEVSLREIYSRALALMLPSSYESFSYVTLEASASGTPVIVSSAVPPEAVIDNVTGFVVKGLDPEAYAEKIELLLNDEELWKELSRKALEHSKRYDVSIVAKQWENVIKQACQRRNG